MRRFLSYKGAAHVVGIGFNRQVSSIYYALGLDAPDGEAICGDQELQYDIIVGLQLPSDYREAKAARAVAETTDSLEIAAPWISVNASGSTNLRGFSFVWASRQTRCPLRASALRLGALVNGSSTFTEELPRAIFLMNSAGFIQLRLLANLLDGLMAVEEGKKTPAGEIYNQFPLIVSPIVCSLSQQDMPPYGVTLGCTAAVAAYAPSCPRFSTSRPALEASLMIEFVLIGLTRFLTGAVVQLRKFRFDPPPAQRLYYANHTSHMDTLLIWASIPRDSRAKGPPRRRQGLLVGFVMAALSC